MRIIKIVGIGNSGNSSVNRIIDDGVTDIDFISIVGYKNSLQKSKADHNIDISRGVLHGLDGGTPERYKNYAINCRDEIVEALLGGEIVVIVTGIGGAVGTGAAPIIAGYARELGMLTIGVFTKPFTFEGKIRYNRYISSIEQFKQTIDVVVVLNCDEFLKIINPKAPMTKAFKIVDDYVCKITMKTVNLIRNNTNNPKILKNYLKNSDESELMMIIGELI